MASATDMTGARNDRLAPLPRLRARAAAARDVVAFGENSWDFVGTMAEAEAARAGADKVRLARFDAMSGGQAATAAVAAARQGCRTRYVGCIGNDAAGRSVRAALEADGVEVVDVSGAQTSSRIAMILVDPETGARTVYEYRPTTLKAGVPAVLRAIEDARILMVDATDILSSLAAARAARDLGIRTLIDIDRDIPGGEDLLAAVDVIVVPEAFAESYVGAPAVEAVHTLHRRFRPALTVVTLGSRGAVACWAGGATLRPPPRAKPIDTTGAGDAFRGGLAAAWIRASDQSESLVDVPRLIEAANVTAAINCEHFGAQTGLPRLAEVFGRVTPDPSGQSK